MLDIIRSIEIFIYPMGILALIGIVLSFERMVFLHKGQVQPEAFLDGIKNLLRKGRWVEGITVCEETPGVVARLTKTILVYAQQKENAGALEDIAQKYALLELPKLTRHIGSLRVIGQMASLIGLMGTLYFFLKGFWTLGNLNAYTHFASFTPYIVSAISVSFIGVLEMFFCYIAYHFLMGRVRALIFDIEWMCGEMLLFLKTQMNK